MLLHDAGQYALLFPKPGATSPAGWRGQACDACRYASRYHNRYPLTIIRPVLPSD